MAKRKDKELENMMSEDDLTSVLADDLNKQYKDYKIAYFLNESEAPTTVNDWVSTGSSILDLVISNKKYCGIPFGKIIEINGLESSGKSLLACHILAETQKKNGIAIYIDTESSADPEFLQAIGVDLSKLIYVQLELVEDIFSTIEHIVTKVKSENRNKLMTIVVDSIAAATTKTELESTYDKDGWATAKSIIISKAMRKITNMIAREKIALVFTNQLRQKLGVTFGDDLTTSGGKAIGFHASVRLRLKQSGTIKSGDDIVGIKCRAQVIKNRVGPPLRKADYEIYFSSGIDNYASWFSVLKDNGLIKQSGAWYSIENEKGEEVKFQSKGWKELIESNPEFRDYIYDKIASEIIMKYKSDSTDEISIDDEVYED